jgi:hypothetical protein
VFSVKSEVYEKFVGEEWYGVFNFDYASEKYVFVVINKFCSLNEVKSFTFVTAFSFHNS